MKRKVYQGIANKLQAIAYLENKNSCLNKQFIDIHQDAIDEIMSTAPSGSGFDSGTELNREETRCNRLVFNTSFHHMNEYGMYSGWSEHSVIVTPDLTTDIDIRVTGRNRDEIKDYIAETFSQWLESEEI